MRASLRVIPALLVALLLVPAVSCESGGSNDSSSNQPAGESGGQSDAGQAVVDGDSDSGNAGGAAVFNAIEALGRSADDFEESVESLQGEMSMDMTMGEMEFGFRSDFAFRSPDGMYMKMTMSGGEGTFLDLSEFGDIEMLMAGDDVYMKMFGAWFGGSLEELGIDSAQLREMMEGRLPLDYTELVEGLGGNIQVQDLGSESLDGGTYHHLRVETDFESLMNAAAGMFEDSFSTAMFPADELSGPVVLDVWLDNETGLPHKLTAEATMASGDPLLGDLSFTMAMVVHQYNGTVVLPEAPEDALSMADLEACLDIESMDECKIDFDFGMFEDVSGQ